MDEDYDRPNKMKNFIQAVKDEGVSEKVNTVASGHTFSRRKFFELFTKGTLGLVIAVLVKGDSDEIIQAIAKLDRYTLSLDYLHSLSKRDGTAYIQGIYYAVNANKISRNQAEKFLRKIFNDEDLLWMREEAVGVLIKLGMLKTRELDMLIGTVPDKSIRRAMAIALGEAGAKDRLIEWSAKTGVTEGIAMGLANAEVKDRPKDYLIERSRKKEEDSYVKKAIAIALGNAGAKDRLIEWSKEEEDLGVREAIAIALGNAGAIDYLIEWSKKEEHQDTKRAIAIALGNAGAIDYLIEWSKKEEDWYIRGAIATALGNAGAIDYLIEWSRKEEKGYVREAIAITLGNAGAIDYLIKWSRKKEEDWYVRRTIAIALGNAGAIDYLIKWSKEEDPDVKGAIAMALANAGAKEYLIEWGKKEKDKDVRRGIASGMAVYFGYRSIGLLQNEILSSSGKERTNLQEILGAVISKLVDNELREINNTVDDNIQYGERLIEAYFGLLRNNPRLLYPILALSHEITSHSFPFAHDYLRECVIDKYESFDIFRYISEEWQNSFLSEFLFTVTIFGQLEDSFQQTVYSPRELADIILSKEKIGSLVNKPALFSKVIFNIVSFKNQDLKDAFLNKIIELGKKENRFKILIRLMLDYNVIQKEQRFVSLVSDVVLPDINPAWDSPRKDWLKDGVLSVGLYWSTEKRGEKAHYGQFPDIFINGSKVSSFYSSFEGYVDKTEDSAYKDKLIKNGAERLLVKEFSGTGKKIEIYLYSSLDAIKNSHHSITISRGHAGERGNSDYPGLPGTLRFASHCRSIDDSDELIKTNPDSPVITITGTGRAVETNPTLYYLLEYLGSKDSWGKWQDIKDYIKPHIAESIRKYNFPTDDVSFIYAVILQKLKSQEERQEASSLNIQMGIIGILKSLKEQL